MKKGEGEATPTLFHQRISGLLPWLLISATAAITYASLWLFARWSRGLSSSIVTSFQSIGGPFLLLVLLLMLDLPWEERWFLPYLAFPFLLVPLASWGLTIACQRLDVTIINPLSALSTIFALFTAWFIFDEPFSTSGILGTITITGGLLLLYHGRWDAWKNPALWLALLCIGLFGIHAAVIREVILSYPHPLVFSGLGLTGMFFLPGIIAGKEWQTFPYTRERLFILSAFAIATLTQDIATSFALLLAEAPYVIAVKRTSILFASLGGYLFFHEREQSLARLLFSCCIVIAGIILLSL